MTTSHLLVISVWLSLFGCTHTPLTSSAGTVDNGVELNDIPSQLNATKHSAVLNPTSIEDIQVAIRDAKAKRQFISISGGKHSMGGQQFGTGTLHLSMSSFNQVISLDAGTGIIEVQSGIQWPELVAWLSKNQAGPGRTWGIRQKQTGADRLSIGGAVSAHSRGARLSSTP